MQAMLTRVTEPVSYQAFQHFITHAPWEADRVWRRLRALIPERRGALILDGTSFPKQGPHSVGAARQYLRGAGQDCQLPSGHHRRALDRRAGVVSRRDAVSARGVADARPSRGGADSGPCAVSREMAARPHLAAPGARGGIYRDRRPRRCRVRRRHTPAHGLASAPLAVRARDFVHAHGVRAAAAIRGATPAPRAPTRPASVPPRDGQAERAGDGPPRGTHAPADRVAIDQLAQWHTAETTRPLHRLARHAGVWLAAAPAAARGVVVVRAGNRPARAAQLTTSSICRPRRRGAGW